MVQDFVRQLVSHGNLGRTLILWELAAIRMFGRSVWDALQLWAQSFIPKATSLRRMCLPWNHTSLLVCLLRPWCVWCCAAWIQKAWISKKWKWPGRTARTMLLQIPFGPLLWRPNRQLSLLNQSPLWKRITSLWWPCNVRVKHSRVGTLRRQGRQSSTRLLQQLLNCLSLPRGPATSKIPLVWWSKVFSNRWKHQREAGQRSKDAQRCHMSSMNHRAQWILWSKDRPRWSWDEKSLKEVIAGRLTPWKCWQFELVFFDVFRGWNRWKDMKGMPFLQLPVKTHNCCSRCSWCGYSTDFEARASDPNSETARTHEFHRNPFSRYPKMFHCIPGAFLKEVEIHATGHHFCHGGSGFQPQRFCSCPVWTFPTPDLGHGAMCLLFLYVSVASFILMNALSRVSVRMAGSWKTGFYWPWSKACRVWLFANDVWSKCM